MPITKSAKKSLKVSRVKAEQNRKREVLLSKALKQVNKDNVSEAISLIDKAAKIGIMHPNKAARLKSQLTKKYGTAKVTKTEKKVAPKKTVKAAPVKAKTPKKNAAPKKTTKTTKK